MTYKENPKTKGSGIVCCIPQTGECPNKCDDCFFQSGRSYLEPLKDNLPNIPVGHQVYKRVVRINDGNDSNVDRDLVENMARKNYQDYFFNTAIPIDLDKFPGPVVLTVNPGRITDTSFHQVPYSKNIMFVRIRVNYWNVENIVFPAVKYYTDLQIPVVLTFMAYYTNLIGKKYKDCYEWKKRTLNSYWCLTQKAVDEIMLLFKTNPLVYSCGYKGTYSCSRCGNCIREYYNALERGK